MRVASFSRNTRSWVTKMSVPPDAWRNASSQAIDSISRWLVGSSSRRISGSLTRPGPAERALHSRGKVLKACGGVEPHSRNDRLHAMVRPGRRMFSIVQSLGHLIVDLAVEVPGDILGQS